MLNSYSFDDKGRKTYALTNEKYDDGAMGQINRWSAAFDSYPYLFDHAKFWP
jgi:hypothetical protein